MKRFAFSSFAVALVLHLGSFVHAENWPGWRGPRGDGTSAEANVPTRWNAAQGENVAWTTPLEGTGHAGPIVWDDRIFLVACNEKSTERTLSSFDRQTGKLLWTSEVIRAPLESKHFR